LPKRGFTNIFARDFAIINLADLERAGLTEVSLETLKKAGVLKTRSKALKVLCTVNLTKAMKITAHAISDSAKAKVEKAGGSVELVA